MRLINQLLWIFLFVFIGELLSNALSVFIVLPGSVIGMILMLVCLHLKVVELEQVDQVGTWLTENMAIFFVPSGVALMTRFDLLKSIWWELTVIIVVTTVLTMVFVGLLISRINKRSQAENLISSSPKEVNFDSDMKKEEGEHVK